MKVRTITIKSYKLTKNNNIQFLFRESHQGKQTKKILKGIEVLPTHFIEHSEWDKCIKSTNYDVKACKLDKPKYKFVKSKINEFLKDFQFTINLYRDNGQALNLDTLWSMRYSKHITSFFDIFIDEYRTQKKGNKLAFETKKKYKEIRNDYEKFSNFMNPKLNGDETNRQLKLLIRYKNPKTFNELTNESIEDFQQYLLRQGQHKTTIQKKMGKFMTVLEFYKKKFPSFIVPQKPPLKQVINKVSKKKKVLSIDMIHQLEEFDVCNINNKAKTDYAFIKSMFLMMCYTAMRFSDLATLTYGNLHQTPNGISIDKHPIKLNASHFNIPLSPKALTIYNNYKTVDDKGMIKLDKYSKKRKFKENDFVFPILINAFDSSTFDYVENFQFNTDYEKEKMIKAINKMNPRLRHKIKRIFKAMGYANWKYVVNHSARHSFISYHVNNGTPIVKVMDWVGHTDMRTTLLYMTNDNKRDFEMVGF